MAKYHSPKEYQDAAQSPATPVEELRRFAQSPYNFVVTAVAWNPTTPGDLLTTLVAQPIVSWDEQNRAWAIAQHRHTPEATLVLLAERLIPILNNGRNNAHGIQAGFALCENNKTPERATHMLLHDLRVSTFFRKRLAQRTPCGNLLEQLRHDRSTVVQAAARQRWERNACDDSEE